MWGVKIEVIPSWEKIQCLGVPYPTTSQDLKSLLWLGIFLKQSRPMILGLGCPQWVPLRVNTKLTPVLEVSPRGLSPRQSVESWT